jgi:hypothetical protein
MFIHRVSTVIHIIFCSAIDFVREIHRNVEIHQRKTFEANGTDVSVNGENVIRGLIQ